MLDLSSLSKKNATIAVDDRFPKCNFFPESKFDSGWEDEIGNSDDFTILSDPVKSLHEAFKKNNGKKIPEVALLPILCKVQLCASFLWINSCQRNLWLLWLGRKQSLVLSSKKLYKREILIACLFENQSPQTLTNLRCWKNSGCKVNVPWNQEVSSL